MSVARGRWGRVLAALLPAVAAFAVVATWAAVALTSVYAVGNLAAWGAAEEFAHLLSSPTATVVYAAGHASPLLIFWTCGLGLAGASSSLRFLKAEWRGESGAAGLCVRETAWLTGLALVTAILGVSALVIGTEAHAGWSWMRIFTRFHEIDPMELHDALLAAPWVALILATAALLAAAASGRALRPPLCLLLMAIALPVIARHAVGVNSLHFLCVGRVEHLDGLFSCLGLPALLLPGLMMTTWVRGAQPSQDYRRLHAARANLLVHLLAVPLFWFGCSRLLWTLAEGHPAWVSGSALMLASLALQGLGHRFEDRSPEPFQGPIDFLRRILAEQLATAPRFLLGGQAWRAWQAASGASGPTEEGS